MDNYAVTRFGQFCGTPGMPDAYEIKYWSQEWILGPRIPKQDRNEHKMMLGPRRQLLSKQSPCVV